VVICGAAVVGGGAVGRVVVAGVVVARRAPLGATVVLGARCGTTGAIVVAGAVVAGGGDVVGSVGCDVDGSTTAGWSSTAGSGAPEYDRAAAPDQTPVRATPPSSPAAVIWLTRCRRRSRVLVR
jgi:hypothetical protein